MFFKIKIFSLGGKPYFFIQLSRKYGLSKKIALEYDFPCIIRKDDISFSFYDLIL